MINSLNGEKDRVDGVLPLACMHKTELVVLALDDEGIPETPEDVGRSMFIFLVNLPQSQDLKIT